MLEGKFVFHNVGQGLFYSGTIMKNTRKFNFIYDCGSEKEENLKKIISYEYLKNLDNELNMLVISHFHKDHISGLKFLLEKKKLKYIFLPYFTEIYRLYILAKNLSFAIKNDWYLKFLINPTEFFLEYRISKSDIYYIHSSNHDGEEDERLIEPNEDFIFMDNLEIMNNSFNLEGQHRTDKGHIQYGYWMFKFFNLKINEKKLKVFKQCIEEKNINLIDLNLSDEKNINFLKDCYKKVKNNLNDTSLVMLHKPLVNNIIINGVCDMSLLKYKLFFLGCDFYGSKCINYGKSYKNLAQLLTGDINLKNTNNYIEFKNYYKKYLKEIILFQVPHHGAKGNWNENILKDLPKCFYYVVSAGRNSRYNHPSFKIFLDVIEEEKCFINVNEDSEKFVLELGGLKWKN